MNYPPTSLTLFSHSHSVRLVAFCLLIFAAASASANSVDPLEFHEVVSADTFAGVITQPRDSLDDYRSLHWQFSALGRDFTLRLTRSTLADSATVVKRGSVSNQTGRDTTSVRRTPPKELPLLVRGQVEGDPDSAVRGTLDHDGFTGWLLTRGQQYYLERSQQLSLPGEDRLVMYRRDQQAVGVTLHDDMRSLSISNSNFAGPGSTVTRSQIPLSGRHGVTRTLTIGIVVDSLYHQQRDYQGVAAALSALNIVDGIYQRELGVAISVLAIVLLDDPATDPLRGLDNSIDELLTSFREFRMGQAALPPTLALVHLFSGLRDPQDLLGLAWIDSACRTDGYDVSVSLPHRFEELLVAHEIAHNLGAVHDDNPACASAQNNIMSSRLSRATQAEFSLCSREFMAPRVNNTCLMHNIDLSVALSVNSESVGDTSLLLTMRNHDSSRTAPSMMNTINFPYPVKLPVVAPFCELDANKLECTFDALGAGERRDVLIPLGRQSRPDAWLTAELSPLGFSDIETVNNRATLLVPASNDGSGKPEVAATVSVQTNADSQAASAGGSLGLVLLVWLSVQALNGILRNT